MSMNSEFNSNNIKENDQNNYALQIALKTMQERCQQLQQRLAIVEDENLNLRLKCGEDKMSLETDSVKSEVDILQNKVAQLTKQKSQLTHNVFMVATENRHLWNRLSKLTHANTSLGNQLLRIKDTLNQHSLGNNNDYNSDVVCKPIKCSELVSNIKRSKNISDDKQTNASLEEISLKLIDSFLKEKSELEHQCAQMTQMQSDESINTNSIGFTYLDDDKDSLIDLKHYSEEICKSKDELCEQNLKLKFILETLIKMKNDDSHCIRCNNKSSEISTKKSIVTSPTKLKENSKSSMKVVNHGEVDQQQNGVCPMCGQFFRNTPFKEFQKHVENHFIDDYVVDNYEIVTNLGI